MRKTPIAAGLIFCVALAGPAAASIVTNWNQAALAEIRLAKLGPPIVARALAVAHTCMYDAWTAYDARAVGAVVGDSLRRPLNESTEANKAKAISFAAHRCLVNLFPAGALRLGAVMRAGGYDPADTSTNPATPQGIGNAAANAVIASRRHDGSNQYGDLNGDPHGDPHGAYADYTGYAPRNHPMPFCTPLIPGLCVPNIADPFHWQPLISNTGAVQKFVAPHWGQVTPFALGAAWQSDDRLVQVPLPQVLQGAARYLAGVEQVIAVSAALTPAQKLIIEYWADGPASELPPGHWGLFAQHVSLRDRHSIDQDVKMFFAMHNASFDAGIVAWYLKRKYDGVRPITAVRSLKRGQSIVAWGGPGKPAQTILGEKWMPYNPGSNLTPAFPGYVSGHAAFSAASAAVLGSFTGSDRFDYSTTLPAGFGRVEPAVPPVPTTLSYATFSAAALEAAMSRLYAGIHFADDNAVGLSVGAVVGKQAWDKAQFLIDGGLAVDATSSAVLNGADELSWSHTVAQRRNRLLVVGLSYAKGDDAVRGVRYGGVRMSRLGGQRSAKNENAVELWYLVAPAVGTAKVVVSLKEDDDDNKDKDVVGGAITFAGVDQRTPFGIFRSSSGERDDPACVTLANAPAQLVATVFAAKGDAKSVAPGRGQRSAWNADTGDKKGDILGAGATVAGAPTATLCYDQERPKSWSMLAVPLKPAVAP